MAATFWAFLSVSLSAGAAIADATDLIPPDYCGVVVASEKSIPLLMASPNLSVYANHDYWILGTNKGAFAAVIGIMQKEGREAVLGELLEGGMIREDAFCSGGDKFWGLATEPPDGALPVFGGENVPPPAQVTAEPVPTLVPPPVRPVSAEEILAAQPIIEGPLESMIPQVERLRDVYSDYARYMQAGTAGNTIGGEMVEPYRCANLGRVLSTKGELGEGAAFIYLHPLADPSKFVDAIAYLDVWLAIAENVLKMSPAQRISTWNLECAGHFGIPASAYRDDDPHQAGMVADGDILTVLGEIDAGFYGRLTEALDQHPEVTIVSLGSGGGSVIDALQAGTLIRERGLKTQLYGKCYSACPMVFAGGVERVIYRPSDAALGFHQIYTDYGAMPMTSGIYALLRSYLEAMGVDADTFIGFMAQAGPEEMFEPDVSELCRPAIATWVQRDCDAEFD